MVGVRVHHDDHLVVSRPPQHVVRGVEPVEAAVDLDGGAGAGGRGQYRVHVQLDAGPAADHAPAEMTDHVDRRILHGADDAAGLGGAVQVERRMHRGHAPVERSAERGVVVEAAVRADVQLHPVQQAQAGVDAGLLAQRGALLQQPLPAHAVEAQILAVVGDRQIGEAARRGRGHHLRQGTAPVTGGVGMQVQVAAQVGQRHRRGQLAAGRGFDLAAVLAHRRRDERQVERGVDVALRRPGEPRSMLVPQPVLVEQPAAGGGQCAQLDVVRRRAGEVERRGSELIRRHHAQVDLQAAPREPASAAVVVEQRQCREALDHGARVGGGHQQVQVGDSGPQAAQAAAVAHSLHRRQLRQRGHHELRVRQHLGDRQPQLLAGHADPAQAPDQRLLGLGAQAGQGAHQMLLQGGLQLLDAGDAQLRPQPRQGPGAEARHRGEPLDGRGKPVAELIQLGDAAALEELAHLAGNRLADAVEPEQLRLRQRRQLLRRVAQPAQRAVVGAGAERLRAAVVENGQPVQLTELRQQFLRLPRTPAARRRLGAASHGATLRRLARRRQAPAGAGGAPYPSGLP